MSPPEKFPDIRDRSKAEEAVRDARVSLLRGKASESYSDFQENIRKQSLDEMGGGDVVGLDSNKFLPEGKRLTSAPEDEGELSFDKKNEIRGRIQTLGVIEVAKLIFEIASIRDRAEIARMASALQDPIRNSLMSKPLGSDFKEDARALLDRCIPNSDGTLRDHGIEIITNVIRSCQSGESEKIKKLAAVAEGTMIAAKKVGGVLPPLPAGYRWPIEKFHGSPEANKKNAVVAFLKRVWTPIIKLKVIHRGHLALVDDDVAIAIERYVYNNGGVRRALPPHVFIPPQRQRRVSEKAEPKKPPTSVKGQKGHDLRS